MNEIEKIVFFYLLYLFFIYTIDITQLKLQYIYIFYCHFKNNFWT